MGGSPNPRRIGAIMLTCLAAAAVLVACDAIQNARDKASICVDAFQAVGFAPSVSDPQQAIADAQQAANELNRLAGETTDQALEDALRDMAGTVGDFDPGDVQAWVSRKGAQLDALRTACA